MSISNERTLRNLYVSNPEASAFVAQVLLVATEVMGHGKELELQIARNVANAFYDAGIIGPELSRLSEYTNGDAEKAYDVLTVDEELEKFRARANQ